MLFIGVLNVAIVVTRLELRMHVKFVGGSLVKIIENRLSRVVFTLLKIKWLLNKVSLAHHGLLRYLMVLPVKMLLRFYQEFVSRHIPIIILQHRIP